MSVNDLHPVTLLVYFVSVIGFTVASWNPVLLLISLIGAFLAFFSVTRRTDFLLYIFMFLLIAVMNPIFSHNGITVLFFLAGQRVTLEAVIYGLFTAVLILAAVYWCKFFSTVFGTDKLTWTVSAFSPKLSVILTMSMRFVPLITANAKDIYNAQVSLKIFDSRKLLGKLKLLTSVFSALISMSLENAIETADTMRSRGFGRGERTSYTLFRFTRRDALFVFYTLISDAIMIFLFGFTKFYYYPYILFPGNMPLQTTVYVIYAFLCFYPFFNEVKESFRWKRLISKI